MNNIEIILYSFVLSNASLSSLFLSSLPSLSFLTLSTLSHLSSHLSLLSISLTTFLPDTFNKVKNLIFQCFSHVRDIDGLSCIDHLIPLLQYVKEGWKTGIRRKGDREGAKGGERETERERRGRGREEKREKGEGEGEGEGREREKERYNIEVPAFSKFNIHCLE
jgi:hypothetical protein